jgi:hypothetical protein
LRLRWGVGSTGPTPQGKRYKRASTISKEGKCGAGPVHDTGARIEGVSPGRQGCPRVGGRLSGRVRGRGEYGEGALRIHSKTAAYYNIKAGSVGFQLGAQKKDIILVFLQQKALTDFRAANGWQAGVDGSVVLVNVGGQASIDSTKFNQPIVGFVVGQQGLMYNLTLEGSKISKMPK